jgi:hypothetical protein
LQRQPDEATALEDSPPATTIRDTEPALGVEEDPAGRLGAFIICNFCMYRNASSNKKRLSTADA